MRNPRKVKVDAAKLEHTLSFGLILYIHLATISSYPRSAVRSVVVAVVGYFVLLGVVCGSAPRRTHMYTGTTQHTFGYVNGEYTEYLWSLKRL